MMLAVSYVSSLPLPLSFSVLLDSEAAGVVELSFVSEELELSWLSLSFRFPGIAMEDFDRLSVT